MATSSITKNFVISGKEQVEMFVNSIEESAKNRPVHIPVAASEITDDDWHGIKSKQHSICLAAW